MIEMGVGLNCLKVSCLNVSLQAGYIGERSWSQHKYKFAFWGVRARCDNAGKK